MHSLDLPAGMPIRLTATARPNAAVHRWEVRVVTTTSAATRLAFGSEIGGDDRHQDIDIPAQAVDCRLEIWARHVTGAGWCDDQLTISDDTPSQLHIGFRDADSSTAQEDDGALSFAFGRAD